MFPQFSLPLLQKLRHAAPVLIRDLPRLARRVLLVAALGAPLGVSAQTPDSPIAAFGQVSESALAGSAQPSAVPVVVADAPWAATSLPGARPASAEPIVLAAEEKAGQAEDSIRQADKAEPEQITVFRQSEGYAWRGPMAKEPDWKGLRRDTWHFLGYQFVIIGLLYVAPESISGWTPEQKDTYTFEKWWDNVTHPVIDSDDWYINYILHPYWGGTYFVRARERGLNSGQSFWYSTLLSTLYEFGAEALFEKVSIQDLILTPTVGSIIGEYWFVPWRERIRAKEGPLTFWDKTVLAVTDPLGAINATVDKWLGIKTTVQVVPMTAVPSGGGAQAAAAGATSAAARNQGVWGMQVRVAW